ncbi:MAG: hypothetical protein ACFFFH_11425 [Candidatus Thorarchaeota archaeon]
MSKYPQEPSWTKYTLEETYYYNPLELIVEDIDPTIPGEEILLIYESALLDEGFFRLFSYNESWTSEVIFSYNPVPTAARIGEFNASHQGTEILCITGEKIILLQNQEGTWKRNKIWDNKAVDSPIGNGSTYLSAVAVADFYPHLPGDEFATCGNRSIKVGPECYYEETVMIFSKKSSSWEPEIIPLGDQTSHEVGIGDMIAINVTNSQQKDIIAVDSDGRVWLVYLTKDKWNAIEL